MIVIATAMKYFAFIVLYFKNNTIEINMLTIAAMIIVVSSPTAGNNKKPATIAPIIPPTVLAENKVPESFPIVSCFEHALTAAGNVNPISMAGIINIK